LELGFGPASIASPPQTVGADQLALRAFDGIAVFHPLFERFGLLLPPSPLQLFLRHPGRLADRGVR
jgi:hypothetical protein